MCTRHENVHSCSPHIEFVRCKLIYHSLYLLGFQRLKSCIGNTGIPYDFPVFITAGLFNKALVLTAYPDLSIALIIRATPLIKILPLLLVQISSAS